MTNNKNIRHTFNNLIVIIIIHILAFGSSVLVYIIGLGTPRLFVLRTHIIMIVLRTP